jgi:hypothetical protein
MCVGLWGFGNVLANREGFYMISFANKKSFNAFATALASGTGTPFPIILNFFDNEISEGRT